MNEPLAALVQTPGVRIKQLDALALLRTVGRSLDLGCGLAEIYVEVEKAVAKANILRCALLYAEGGVYIDLDTITIKSLLPLLEVPAFVGCEFIVWPHDIHRSLTLQARSIVLSSARDILRRLPKGYLAFRQIAHYYHRAVNNAVLGSKADSQLMASCLRAMALIPKSKLQTQFVLGTHLLQRVVDDYQVDDLVVHPPDVFYVLPPEISEHWFRGQANVDLDSVLQPDTRIVHWYASVRTKHLVPLLTPGYVKEHQTTELFSAMVERYAHVGSSKQVKDPLDIDHYQLPPPESSRS